jgi:hypothetical protein
MTTKRFTVSRLRESLKISWYWWLGFILFNLGDEATTLIFTAHGLSEGNPLWHTSILSPLLGILKVFVFPCVVIPFVAILLSPQGFKRFMRQVAVVFALVVIWNTVGILFHHHPHKQGVFAPLALLGITTLLMLVASILLYVWDKIAARLIKRGIRVDLDGMMEVDHALE